MRIETLPGIGNVIRFPVELRERPTMELLRQLQPDTRLLFTQVEDMGYELPPRDLRDQTDRATAEHIAAHCGRRERASEPFLDGLLQPLLDRAVEAARKADDVAAAASGAQQAARPTNSYAAERARERAAGMTERAVQLGLEAYLLSEQTEGAARAISFARRGEQWTPRDHDVELDLLIAAKKARRASA